jgi:hypothetical protein
MATGTFVNVLVVKLLLEAFLVDAVIWFDREGADPRNASEDSTLSLETSGRTAGK